uniref:Geranylgeranyl transferase type-2 subunit alpha n=1 Tax=Hyaloperonospora arabidopsidis (strain Emoy2) TaxID=559515 RepID=M4C4N4_HYAAE
MHGRVKSIQLEHEQQKTIEQRQEEVSKVRMYHEVASKVLEMKRQQLYEPSVLPLTSHLLLLNPEFHMLWSYRRQVITALAKKANNFASKMQELAKIELEMTLRKWIIDQGLGDLKKEIGLCDKLLDLDERNFHCWNYRRHVCEMAGVSKTDQLAFTTKKIEQNFSNYSALHHRSTVLPEPITVDVLSSEIELVQQAVFTEPDDQSAWFYYRWLLTSMLDLMESSPEDAAGFLKTQVQWLEQLLEMEKDAKWVVVTLADVRGRVGAMTSVDGWQDSKKQSAELYERAIKLDPSHRRYYEDRKTRFL